MLIRFHNNMKYNEHEFLKNHVYDLSEDYGFAGRWIVRGCEQLDSYDGEILPDPVNPPKKIEKKEVLKEVVKEEIQETPIDNKKIKKVIKK